MELKSMISLQIMSHANVCRRPEIELIVCVVEIIETVVKNMHLNCTLPLMESIIERETTFENNSDKEVTETQK